MVHLVQISIYTKIKKRLYASSCMPGVYWQLCVGSLNHHRGHENVVNKISNTYMFENKVAFVCVCVSTNVYIRNNLKSSIDKFRPIV